MIESLDAASPVPLYHQLAEVIRYRIATGRIKPGDRLPPVREAAAQWHIHMHTVRRAYAELAKDSLVDLTRAKGTTVLAVPRTPTSDLRVAVHRDIHWFVRNMERKHGLSAARVAELITQFQAEPTATPTMAVVECSQTQADDYAAQVESRWSVRVAAFCLRDTDDLPSGPILSTYFHFNDVRSRWPERIADMHFVSVRPDPAILDRLCQKLARKARLHVTLAEVNAARADNILPDVCRLLPADRFRVTSEVFVDVQEAARCAIRGPVLFAPRLWAQMSEDQRNEPNVLELRYLLDVTELGGLAEALGWSEVVAHRVSSLSRGNT